MAGRDRFQASVVRATAPPSTHDQSAAIALQRGFRRMLSFRAAAQARQLLVDELLLWQLASVVARTEARCAALIQWRWRAIRKGTAFKRRLATKRMERAVLARKAQHVAKALERQVAQEHAETVAAIKLQAQVRRRAAARIAVSAARSKAVHLLRAQFSANRQQRAIARVQRQWIASLARRREVEARSKAAAAEQLVGRLARARAAELRTKHMAKLIARHLKRFAQRRVQLARELRGWLSKHVQPGSKAPYGYRWQRRFFWVHGGTLLYDSVRWRTAHARGLRISDLSEAVRMGPCEFELHFGGSAVKPSLTLRAGDEATVDFWVAALLWLARMPITASPPTRRLERRPASSLAKDDANAALLTALDTVEAGRPPASRLVRSDPGATGLGHPHETLRLPPKYAPPPAAAAAGSGGGDFLDGDSGVVAVLDEAAADGDAAATPIAAPWTLTKPLPPRPAQPHARRGALPPSRLANRGRQPAQRPSVAVAYDIEEEI